MRRSARRPRSRSGTPTLRRALLLFIIAIGATASISGVAIAIEIDAGDVQGSLDTTVSWGSSIRVGERDQDIIGRENGGNAHSVNGDDGNLNYDQGDFVSNTLKLTHELQLNWANWSVFGRGFYFRDFQTMDWADPPQRTALTNAAKNEIGYEIKLLDAYLAGGLSIGNTFLNFRVGNQALNWGESTFIQNGINSMSTVDVSKLRVAGSELREALEAIPMVSASWTANERFSFEGFVPFVWRHTEIEAAGSFFSTNDFASPGGSRVLLGFGEPGISDTEINTGVGAPVGVDVNRVNDVDARDGGEFGVAFRWFEPGLNDTEFGFYYTHLHSRLPLISGWTGLLNEGFAAGNYAATANFFREFPEEIDKWGFGFNTELPRIGFLTGTAIQGEISLAKDQPLQVDDVELLFAALSPLDAFIGFGGPDEGFKLSQLANGTPFGFDEKVSGVRRKDVIQAQAAVTKLIGPSLGVDQWTFLGEAGVTIVQDMEEKSELRYEGPGTYTSGTDWFTETLSPSSGNPLQPATETDGFADDVSWGYRLVLRAAFNDLISSINVQPTLVWFHDVRGTSPSPILNFVDGRKTITAALAADYLISWSARLTYTNSFGGDRYNLQRDRDFVSVSMSYSF